MARNMSGDNLHAPDEGFKLLLNQSLIVKGTAIQLLKVKVWRLNYPHSLQGKMYSKGDYCLDYLVDYCSYGGTSSVELRAIIRDAGKRKRGTYFSMNFKDYIFSMAADYIESSGKASTIFGSSRDSKASRLLKQIGYPASVLFLAATLAVFIVLPDLRRDIHGKMVICLVASQGRNSNAPLNFLSFIGCHTIPKTSTMRM